MKLSFSTLGCPNWSFDEIMCRAGQYGYDGVAFRGLGGELDLTKVPEFSSTARANTRRRLKEAGLTHTMVLTSPDSVTDFEAKLGFRYGQIGDGEIPLKGALQILTEARFDGWLTFEWEKVWHPTLSDPSVAFPEFIARVRALQEEVVSANSLKDSF